MWRYWSRGWCPRHPWPPPWAAPYPLYYRENVEDEIRYLQYLKMDLERQIEEISKRIDELKKLLEKNKQ